MALAGGVLDQARVAGTEYLRAAVTAADLELPRENDDELSARRRVPVEEAVLRPDAERDLRGRQTLEPVGLLLDVDRLEMRLPVRPGVEPPGLRPCARGCRGSSRCPTRRAPGASRDSARARPRR